MFQGLETEIIGAIVIGLVVWAYQRWWRIIAKRTPLHTVRPLDETERERVELPVTLPPGLTIVEKVEFLERELESTPTSATLPGDRAGADVNRALIVASLAEMTFLEQGDVLEDSFQLNPSYDLLERLGGGRTSVVWKARDRRAKRIVAIKFLRYQFNRDRSVVEQFRDSARLMSVCSESGIAAVRQEVQELPEAGRLKLAYYVLDYIEGVPLDKHVPGNTAGVTQCVEKLLELGRCVTRLHAAGVLHRDIKPGNVIVQPGGTMKLVDFDDAIKVGATRAPTRSVGTFGYAAPEVLDNWPNQDPRVDVFALGRVLSHAYYGAALPNTYNMSVADQVDVLNCTPNVKRALGRATAVRREDRHATMQELIDDMQAAVKESDVAFFSTLRHERSKIYRSLRDAVYGTLFVMIIARPLLASWQVVHLSDTPWVAAFHAFIGSLVWGALIPLAYLCYLILLRRHGPPGYILAMLCCGIGGFLGGVLCSIPSVIVTHLRTLCCLGWLHTAVDGGARFKIALLDTRMMLAYPLTGLFTGMGVGLALNRGIELALRASPQGTGVLPVPSKLRGTDRRDALRFLRPLLLSARSHLFLAFPIIFSFVVAYVLSPSTPPPALICRGVQPNEALRCLGEGFVHYAGAVGLMLGFFYGLPTESTTEAAQR